MDGGPFKYEITNSGSYHWKSGAVCVYEQDVTVDVPAGIDLISKAFDTLNAAKVQAQVDYNQRIMDIDKQIHQLLMLTHQPEPQPEDNDHDLVGELITECEPQGDPDFMMGTDDLECEVVDDYRGADHE